MPKPQVLGELHTGIVGTRYHEGTLDAGAPVRLVREPGNAHDPNAIRVDNGQREPVGHLPRRTAAWLAPLLDDRRISVKVCQLFEGPDAPVPIHVDVPLVLKVRLLARGCGMVKKPRRLPGTELEVLHEIVRRVFTDAEHYADPGLSTALAGRLQALSEGRLYPETRLLLALLPSRGALARRQLPDLSPRRARATSSRTESVQPGSGA